MTPAPFPSDELERLHELQRLHVLDTSPEALYDDIVLLASTLCDAPIALISLIDANRQWFKACIGLNVRQTHRDEAFCAHAILKPDDVMIIADATADSRFSDNPLVTGAPHIRFYAGAPIVTRSGLAMGTVCVIDQKPRILSDDQTQALRALARLVASLLEQREQGAMSDARNRLLQRKVSSALADDTAQHATLRRDQRVDAVGQLTGAVAHDFNNLLQSISMSLQLIMLKADSAADVRRFAGSGLAAVKRGADLVAQLLTFSREQTPSTSRLCVSDHLQTMQELLTRTLPSSVELTFNPGTKGCLVMINATQLEASVLNMVINARDAMNGSGRIDISTRRIEVRNDPALADGEYVVLTVHDNGPGMPADVAARAFEPFFTTKSSGKGTGLGLSQVIGVAERAGGTARIETSPEAGTSIAMLLRIVQEGEQAKRDAVETANRQTAAARAEILLVDDDHGLRRALCQLLVDAGYAVTTASNGIEALTTIELSMPDVVLTALGMQGMSGALLARVLEEMHPRLPVIFMTADPDIDSVAPRLPPGAPIVRKPALIEAFVAAIDTALGKRETS